MNKSPMSIPAIRPAHSYLCLPVGDERLLHSKLYQWGARQADFIILDLEDSLPSDKKVVGRKNLREIVDFFKKINPTLSVRINNDSHLAEDCRVVRGCGITKVLVPKCESAKTLEIVSDLLDDGQTEYSIYPVIESAKAVINYDALLEGRISFSTVFFGCEDFATSIGVLEPNFLNTLLAVQSLIYRSAPRGIGVVGSHSRFSAFSSLLISEYRKTVEESRLIGFSGTLAVHPKQVPIVNDIYRYSGERQYMTGVLEMGTQKGGVFSHGGRMYGPPMLKRFKKILNQ